MRVADYSDIDISPEALKAAGFIGSIRYYSPPPNDKNWTPALIALHRAAGEWLGMVWETRASRPVDGYAAGAADATYANILADQDGWPATVAMYYNGGDGPDYSPTQVFDYFRGVASVQGRPVGVYGSKEVCEAMFNAGHARYMWMVESWWQTPPGPLNHPKVHLVQLANYHSLAGTDDDVIMQDDWGGWPPAGVSPVVTPSPWPAVVASIA